MWGHAQAERPVGREPVAAGPPEGDVERRVARPYPGKRTGFVVVAAGQRVDVDAPDDVAGRRTEHRVGEAVAT